MTEPGEVHIGIGGWTFPPWRGVFYPPGLRQARELEHAAAQVTAIEINSTYYRAQKPKSFAKWAKAVPPGFKFSVKASRYCTNRKILADAGESIDHFVGQGLTELGDKLGPILWQFSPFKHFEADDFAAFLKLLPARQDGVLLRHAVEVRHESFRDPAFVALARQYHVAIVFADSAKHPQLADLTADFVYARLQNAREDIVTGYSDAALVEWRRLTILWTQGGQPDGLDYAGSRDALNTPREVYIFMINGAKVRAPAAAQALLELLARA